MIDGREASLAWQEWAESKDGQIALGHESIGVKKEFSQYLQNRIQSAFQAGVNAGHVMATKQVQRKIETFLLDI